MTVQYILYQITNNLNGKIYVGVHRTRNLDDGYMGSGKVIGAAIAKYGVENFTKVILETFDTSEAMYAREKEVVTDEFLLREDTYNLRRGGHGGFDYINKAGLTARNPWPEYAKERAIAAIKNKPFLEWSVINLTRYSTVDKETRRKWNETARIATLSPASAKKRKATLKENAHQQGEKNSQFGSMWITNGTINKKIPYNSVIPEGWSKGRFLKHRLER